MSDKNFQRVSGRPPDVLSLVFIALVAVLNAGTGCASGPVERAVRLAESADRLVSVAVEDSLLAAEQGRPTAERVGLWARRFAGAPGVRYVFGPKPDGYVGERELIRDHRQDCVSLMYRCGELARARDHADAVVIALDTRFAGASLDSVVDLDGHVNYDDPHHLDFSLDMVRSGHWGRDVTGEVGGAVADTVGTARYAAGSFQYVPKGALDGERLHEGDVVWFVLDPTVASARKLRDQYGLVIGHIGLVIVEEGQPWLVHAASSGLDGWYEGGTVVRVPLAEYLNRVDRFAGVIVTRY